MIRTTMEDDVGLTPVRDVMTAEVHTAGPDTTLRAAAEQMRAADIGFLPVVDESGPIGVVTDRDIAIRGTRRGLDPGEAVLRDVMTPIVSTVQHGQNLEHAVQAMVDRRVRRVVVLSDRNEIVGVVAVSDVIAAGAPVAALAEVLATAR